MRPYEVVIILDASAQDADVDKVVERMRAALPESAGKVGQIEKWGRRRFAYEVKHRWEGHYSLVEMTADPAAVAEVDRILLLSDDVIRHKIVRLPETVAERPRPAVRNESAEEAEDTGVSA